MLLCWGQDRVATLGHGYIIGPWFVLYMYLSIINVYSPSSGLIATIVHTSLFSATLGHSCSVSPLPCRNVPLPISSWLASWSDAFYFSYFLWFDHIHVPFYSYLVIG